MQVNKPPDNCLDSEFEISSPLESNIRKEAKIINSVKNIQYNNKNVKIYPRKGQIPYGYDKFGDVLIENQYEQLIILQIKEYKNNGQPLREISRRLNKKRVKTKNGGKWQANTVKKILERKS
ncbi:recombinase family protein [Spirochaetota bacterium]